MPCHVCRPHAGPEDAAISKGRALLADASTGDLGPPGGHSTIDDSYRWFGTYTGIVFITVAVLPLAAATVWAIARRRRRCGHAQSWAWCMCLAEVGIVFGTV